MIRRAACVSGLAILGLLGCTASKRPELGVVQSQAEDAIRDAAVVFHVSTSGNDANPGTAVAPFATPARAQTAVREFKDTGGALPGPVTVLIHEGVYRLREPLAFTPKDSGTADAPITYQAVPGEDVVISGGRRVSDWRKHDGNVWVADVPWAAEKSEPFVQLFVDGQRRPRARTPNAGTYFYSKRLKLDKKLCKGMTFAEKDILRWPGFEENARIVLFHNWEQNRAVPQLGELR